MAMTIQINVARASDAQVVAELERIFAAPSESFEDGRRTLLLLAALAQRRVSNRCLARLMGAAAAVPAHVRRALASAPESDPRSAAAIARHCETACSTLLWAATCAGQPEPGDECSEADCMRLLAAAGCAIDAAADAAERVQSSLELLLSGDHPRDPPEDLLCEPLVEAASSALLALCRFLGGRWGEAYPRVRRVAERRTLSHGVLLGWLGRMAALQHTVLRQQGADRLSKSFFDLAGFVLEELRSPEQEGAALAALASLASDSYLVLAPGLQPDSDAQCGMLSAVTHLLFLPHLHGELRGLEREGGGRVLRAALRTLRTLTDTLLAAPPRPPPGPAPHAPAGSGGTPGVGGGRPPAAEVLLLKTCYLAAMCFIVDTSSGCGEIRAEDACWQQLQDATSLRQLADGLHCLHYLVAAAAAFLSSLPGSAPAPADAAGPAQGSAAAADGVGSPRAAAGAAEAAAASHSPSLRSASWRDSARLFIMALANWSAALLCLSKTEMGAQLRDPGCAAAAAAAAESLVRLLPPLAALEAAGGCQRLAGQDGTAQGWFSDYVRRATRVVMPRAVVLAAHLLQSLEVAPPPAVAAAQDVGSALQAARHLTAASISAGKAAVEWRVLRLDPEPGGQGYAGCDALEVAGDRIRIGQGAMQGWRAAAAAWAQLLGCEGLDPATAASISRGADCAALSCLAAIPSLEEALLCVDNPYRRSAAPCVQLRALTPLLQSPQLADLLLWAGAMQPLLSAARRLLAEVQANDTTLPTLSTESIGELLVLLTQLLLCPWAAAAIATDAQLLSMLSTEARVLAEEVSLDTADGVIELFDQVASLLEQLPYAVGNGSGSRVEPSAALPDTELDGAAGETHMEALLAQAAARFDRAVAQLDGTAAAAALQEMQQAVDQPAMLRRQEAALGLRRCSYPGCGNLAGPAEAALKTRRCSACRVVRYCGEACSHEDWRRHKKGCKLLRPVGAPAVPANAADAARAGQP